VAVVVFDGVVLTDFAIPCDVFRLARLGNGDAAYGVRVCGEPAAAGSSPVDLIAGAPLTLLARLTRLLYPASAL
jgi:hypothetical protein